MWYEDEIKWYLKIWYNLVKWKVICKSFKFENVKGFECRLIKLKLKVYLGKYDKTYYKYKNATVNTTMLWRQSIKGVGKGCTD